jgi:hypothetical protein
LPFSLESSKSLESVSQGKNMNPKKTKLPLQIYYNPRIWHHQFIRIISPQQRLLTGTQRMVDLSRTVSNKDSANSQLYSIVKAEPAYAYIWVLTHNCR